MSSNSADGLQVLSRRGYDGFVRLDSGGQATVYMTKKEDKIYAIKVVKVEAKDGQLEDDLKREMSIVINLKHPNCVRVTDLFRTKHKVYIVMDYMQNGTVRSYVRKEDGICEWNAKVWFCPIARAVRYLHENNVAHRDIKLENILLDQHMNPILTDFGFSRFVGVDTKTRKIEKSDTYCGTPSYNPPEIVKKKHYNPFRADVWCLGICLFIMVNKEKPFDKKDRKLMYENQCNRNYNFRDSVEAELSQDFKDLVYDLLEPDFTKRIDIHKVCDHYWFPIDSRTLDHNWSISESESDSTSD